MNEPTNESTLAWEAAYLRFETPEQEIRKFTKRLRQAGQHKWQRNAQIVELCCGRGNGLHALSQLGFIALEGIDLSPSILAHYRGNARVYAADCRHLPLNNHSRDIVIVQGGLHHLPQLPKDLEQTLVEVRRVLREDGTLMIVEPWLSPFLRAVHLLSQQALMRNLFPQVQAFATMVRYERETYEQWLGARTMIRTLLDRFYIELQCHERWGKLLWIGKPRPME